VVIAIIGVLVALLLPAIQAAREAARRTTCVNQLKQIGLGIQNHVSARGVFPTGGSRYNPDIANYVSGGTSNPGTPNGPEKQGLGWAYQILPYLEQNAVVGLVTQSQLQTTVIPVYNCPSRRTAQVLSTDVTIGGGMTVLTDYAAAHPATLRCPDTGTGMTYDLSKSIPFQGYASHSQVALPAYWCTSPGEPTANSVYDGVIVRTQWSVKLRATATAPAQLKRSSGGPDPIKPAQISDGQSNTLLISEKLVRNDLIEGRTPSGQSSYSDDRGWTDGWDPDTIRFTGYQPISDSDSSVCFNANTSISKYCTGEGVDTFFFGSSHPSGINAVFVDGSVHHISFSVDGIVFNALGTRNGEEIVDISKL
jgi:prepilin-type processing-associated H-X9-DG protein